MRTLPMPCLTSYSATTPHLDILMQKLADILLPSILTQSTQKHNTTVIQAGQLGSNICTPVILSSSDLAASALHSTYIRACSTGP